MGKKSKRKSFKQQNSPKASPGFGCTRSRSGVDSIDDDPTPKLEINDRVTLRNLEAEDYNGKVGRMKYLPKSPVNVNSRYGVLLDGSKKAIGIQAKNLEQLFKIGDRVSLRGLVSKEYNGLYGTVVKLPESAETPRYGVQPEVNDKPISVRPSNMFLSNRMTTQEQKTARDRFTSHTELSEDECMNADQLAMMRTMKNMFLTEEKQIAVYGRKIDPMPDFRAELLRAGLPKGINHSWADKYLRLAFEQASGLPHDFELAFKSKDYEPAPCDVAKRLGSNDRSTLEWYFAANSNGAINPNRRVSPYCPFFRHSFSNQTYRKEKLQLGTTHVAVGFVDLGILFAMDLADHDTNHSDGPLHFIGIDMSAYAVAKAHVLWELLMQTPKTSPLRKDHLFCLLQVWFSATWGEGTETAVKICLSRLCQPGRKYHPSAREILEYWADAPTLGLEAIRTEIMKVKTSSRSFIGHLLRIQDRVAMAMYELTGDFGINGEAVCGNTLMFDCPDGTPPLDKDETVFSAFSLIDITRVLKDNESTNMTVIGAAEAYSLAKVSKLASLLQSGQVTMELVCAKVEDVVDRIAAKMPWTMSWSNVPDYVDYGDFHQLARRCSVHGDTIHFGYSMNWVTEVLGTNLIDFTRTEAQVEVRAQLLNAANKSVDGVYGICGLKKFLRLPPPTNPINTVSSYGLSVMHYREWAQHFFDTARRQGPCQVANLEHACDSPLSNTGSSTVYFTWTYDPEINFRNDDPFGVLNGAL